MFNPRPNIDSKALPRFVTEMVHKFKQFKVPVFDQSAALRPANSTPKGCLGMFL